MKTYKGAYLTSKKWDGLIVEMIGPQGRNYLATVVSPGDFGHAVKRGDKLTISYLSHWNNVDPIQLRRDGII